MINNFGYPNNTYVGMRYVPKFDGEWTDSKDYEPLTVVQYNNNSYTSKTFVPAGVIPQGNKKYWAETGNYNAQVEQYRNEVLNYQKSVDDISITLDDYGIVDGTIAVWVGDSYVQANSLGNEQLTSRFSKLVSDKLKMTEKNYAVGGTGYVTHSSGNDVFLNQLQTAVADIGDSIDKVRYVFIGGGRNDFNSSVTYSSMTTAVVNTLSYAVNNFRNAKIVVLPMLYDWKTMPDKCRILYTAILDGYKKVSSTGNFVISEKCYKWFWGRPNYILWQDSADVHYTVAGHLFASNYIMALLNGSDTGSFAFNSSVDITVRNIVGKAFWDYDGDTLHLYGYFKTPESIENSPVNIISETVNTINIARFVGAIGFIPIPIYNRSSGLHTAVGALSGNGTRTGDDSFTNTVQLRITAGDGTQTLYANEEYYFDFWMTSGMTPFSDWT